MIVFEGDVCFSREALKAVNWCIYNFIEPVVDLMDIFHLDPNNNLEMQTEMEGYFPDYFIRENPRLCIDVLLDLASWTRDDFMHKMNVVHEYALHQILWHETSYWKEEGEEGEVLLRTMFAYPEMDKVPPSERDYFDQMAEEGFDAIVDLLFRDTDFLAVDQISSWELVNSPVNQMMGVDVEYLVPLMPRDVREQIDGIYSNNEIFRILSAVQSVINSLESRPALLERRTEEEISAQIAMGLNMALSQAGLGVSQETPFGYSPAGTGEVDFYVYGSDLAPMPKAIGECKMWGRFHSAVDQLMGYMNEGVDLGFTVTINKSHDLKTVKKKQKAILENYSIEPDDFKIIDIGESKFGGWLCLQRHPENDRPFITNHFILNLYRPSRKKAAARRGKRKNN